MSATKPQRAAKTSETTPANEALLQAILDELRAIRARLERMDLDEQIARGVRWAIGGRGGMDGRDKQG